MYVRMYIHTYIRTYLRTNKQYIQLTSHERCVWLLCVWLCASTPRFGKSSHTSIPSSLYFYVHRPSSLGRGLPKILVRYIINFFTLLRFLAGSYIVLLIQSDCEF